MTAYAIANLRQVEMGPASPAYRLILPLRTEHSEGEAILIDEVDPGHRATDLLAGL